MFDVHNQSAPINILKLSTKLNILYSYLQYSIIQIAALSTKYSRLNLQKGLSRVFVSKFGLNKILKELKTLPKDLFNKQMKTSLFQILDNEDSYLDVKNISSKLKDCIIKTNWSDCFTI